MSSGANAFILANHGIVALGTDPDRAVFNMALLEKVSIAYLLALTTESGKIYTIPDAIREIALTKLRADEKKIGAQITKGMPPLRVPSTDELPSADAVAAAVSAAPATTASGAAAPAATGSSDGRGGQDVAPADAISEYPDVPGIMRRL